MDFKDIRSALIGEGTALAGPFGPRALIYADYVASGRAPRFWLPQDVASLTMEGAA